MTQQVTRYSPSGPASNTEFQVVIDHGTITAATVDVATYTATGMVSGDYIRSIMPVGGWKTGLSYGGSAWVSANVAQMYISNPTVGNITTGSVVYTVEIGKGRLR